MTTANSPSDNDSDDSKEYDENIVNVLEELQKKIIAGQPIQPETIYQQSARGPMTRRVPASSTPTASRTARSIP